MYSSYNRLIGEINGKGVGFPDGAGILPGFVLSTVIGGSGILMTLTEEEYDEDARSSNTFCRFFGSNFAEFEK